MNSADPQFNKPNSALLDISAKSKLGSSDPQLFINRIKQTVVTNESFTMQNPSSKPRLEENISNLNETTKILDTSPQQYSPVHFRQTFEQIQAQQKDKNIQYSQQQQPFNPFIYSNQIKLNQPASSTKSSLDVVMPQLMNPLNNAQLANQHLANPILVNQQQRYTSPLPPSISSIYGRTQSTTTANILKRLQQQQLQNSLLARLGNSNLNSNLNTNQERATRNSATGNLNSSPSTINSSPSMMMDASKNSKEFFTRRTNTHRYVIVSILMIAIIVISIGISVIYIKQRRLNLHNIQVNAATMNPSDLTKTSSSYGIRRFYQRSTPNSPSDSDSYGPSYLSNRSVASVETGSTITGPPKTLTNLRTSNIITHR